MTPWYVTGANEAPVAISARPPVHAIRSAGFASERVCGFDNAKMMGLSMCDAISRTMASVNAPASAEAPISMVGLTRRTTSSNSMPLDPCFQFLTSALPRTYED